MLIFHYDFLSELSRENAPAERLLLGMKPFICKHLLFGPAGASAFLAPYLLVPFLLLGFFTKDERFDLIGKDPSG